MCHSLANLEYHHFKYAAHRRPGDVHLHFFGTATLSFADGITRRARRRVRGGTAGISARRCANPLARVARRLRFDGVRRCTERSNYWRGIDEELHDN